MKRTDTWTQVALLIATFALILSVIELVVLIRLWTRGAPYTPPTQRGSETSYMIRTPRGLIQETLQHNKFGEQGEENVQAI